MSSIKEQRRRIIVFVVTLIMGILACNIPGKDNGGNSSFDNAQLMMFTNRGILGFYEETENLSIQNNASSISLVSFQENSSQQSSKDCLNGALLLAEEYKKKADLAYELENQVLYKWFENRYHEQLAKAESIKKERAEWRRRRRFNSILNRIGHGIGQAMDFSMQNVGRGADMAVDYYVEDYVERVKRFVRNPVRYGFNHYVSIQLGILKNQFIDKAGPFFGTRAYELTGIDYTAELVEEKIFGEEQSQQPTSTEQNIDETGNSSSLADLPSAEDCIAPPEMYAIEFSDEYHWSNPEETSKQICRVKFTVRNLSGDELYINKYHLSDNGAMHSESWIPIIVGTGESYECEFETQIWTHDGSSTMKTITQIVFGKPPRECFALLQEENKIYWESYIIAVDDPCR